MWKCLELKVKSNKIVLKYNTVEGRAAGKRVITSTNGIADGKPTSGMGSATRRAARTTSTNYETPTLYTNIIGVRNR